MSILTGKHVLVVGEETGQINKIEAALITYGAEIATTTCEKVDPQAVQAEHTGLILLNHLHDGMHCKDMLESLRSRPETKNIPTFALVQNDQTHIAEVLLLGASDYFTESEDVHLVIDKIKSVLGDEHTDSHTSVIDLSVTHADDQAGTRVFAVEDDSLLQNLLAIRFEKSGLEFELASDGIDLVEKVAAFLPQIVILDLMLPGEDGFALLKKLKADPRTGDIPVLIFSNKDDQTDRNQAKELGAAAFFVKAMTDLSELMDIISKHKKQ